MRSSLYASAANNRDKDAQEQQQPGVTPGPSKHQDRFNAIIRFNYQEAEEEKLMKNLKETSAFADSIGESEPEDKVGKMVRVTNIYDNVKVVSNKALHEIGQDLQRSNSTLARNIYYIQTTVKDVKGVGSHVDVDFKAPLDDTSYEDSLKEINFEGFRGVDELRLLKQGHFQRYAHIQCLKICYYLQKVRNIEVLQMRAEFLRDDCDNVWFVFARKIHYRRLASSARYPGLKEDSDAH